MSNDKDHTPEYEGWALLEIMGHRQTAGRICEVQIGGATMLRVDVPKPGHGGASLASDEIAVTQYYGGSSIYCMTPCDEKTAREALKRRYGLPAAVQLALPATKPADPEDVDVDELDDEQPF